MPLFDFHRFAGRPGSRNVRINLRLVAILLVTLGLSAGLAHFVRGMQLDRNAKSLRHKAEEAYAQGNLDAAIGYQARYVTFRPLETDELVRLAEWSDENARSPREWFSALQQVDRALTQATTRDDLRHRGVRLAAKLAQFPDVLKRVNELREKDAEMLAIEARAHAALGEYDRAVEAYKRAIKESPAMFANYEELLALCERHAGKLHLNEQAMQNFFFPPPPDDKSGGDAPPEGDASDESDTPEEGARPLETRFPGERLCEPIVQAMVERAEPKFRAWLARARYNLAHGKLSEAAADVTRGREAAPDDPEVLLMATEIETSLANEARTSGHAEAANQHAQAAIELGKQGLVRAPSDARFHLTLSRLNTDAGHLIESELILREGLKVASEARPGERDEGRADARLKSRVIWALASTLITQAFPANGPQNLDKTQEAEELIEQLRHSGARPAWIDFLQARIRLGKNEWDAAERRLERARGGLADVPGAVRSVDRSLADCYARLSNPDARLRVFRRAIDEDPFWIQGRLGLADALVSLGQFDAALEQYAHKFVKDVPGVAARVSQLLIRKQMALPEKQRGWDQVERVVALAEEQAAGSPQGLMLRADLLLQQRRFDVLDRLLNEALERDSSQIAYWVALAESALRQGKPGDETRVDRAEEVLERARAQLGDRLELRLLTIRLAIARGGSQAIAILNDVETAARGLPTAERTRVYRMLASAWQATGKSERGLALWQTITDEPAADLDDHLFLADLATRAGDQQALRKALLQIRRIEGPGGPNGDYAEAAALIINASRNKRKAEADGARPSSDSPRRTPYAADLERAQRLLMQAARQRQSWAAVPRTLGLLEELRGNRDEAFEQFRRAMALGDRTRDTVQQVIMRLNALGRYPEAREELRRAVETAPDLLSGDLARLASVVAMKLQDVDEALSLAGRIEPEARNFGDLLWQAELEYSKGERGAKIDELLRQATVTAPDVDRTWVTRVSYLVRENRADEARQVTAEAAERFPPERAVAKFLTLGLCCEALGDRPGAELNFLKAIDADPADVGPKTETLNFYVRGNELAKADGLAEKLIDPAQKAPPSVAGAALRTRALIRAAGGTYEDLQAGLAMISSLKHADLVKVDEADLRVAAAILGRSRLRRERDQQLRILEELQRRLRLKDIELLQLARLLEGAGRWAGARSIYRSLLEKDPSNAAVLAEFVLTALRQKALDQALLAEVAERVDQLERREPDSFRTALARARYLAADSRQKEAAGVLQKYLAGLPVSPVDERLRELVGQKKLEEAIAHLAEAVRRKDDTETRNVLAQAQKLRRAGDDEAALAALRKHVADADRTEAARVQDIKRVAGALESLEAVPAAEEVFRQYAQSSARTDGQLALISFLARHNRIDEALDACGEIPETTSAPVLARVSLGVLRAGHATPEQIARVEQRITAAADKAGPESRTGIELALAEIREIQGRFPEVLEIYRGLLERNDRNVMALNNLAWFQSFNADRRRGSLELINRAVQLAGPDPELLDTRAVIQLNLDSPREAIRDLEQALKENNTPSLWFHLALAQIRVGDKAAAAESFHNAEQAGFDPGTLHPFEKPDYDKLIKTLGPAKSGSDG